MCFFFKLIKEGKMSQDEAKPFIFNNIQGHKASFVLMLLRLCVGNGGTERSHNRCVSNRYNWGLNQATYFALKKIGARAATIWEVWALIVSFNAWNIYITYTDDRRMLLAQTKSFGTTTLPGMGTWINKVVSLSTLNICTLSPGPWVYTYVTTIGR